MYIYIYICIYIFTYLYIYMYTHTRIYIYKYLYLYMYIYVCIYTHVYTSVHRCTWPDKVLLFGYLLHTFVSSRLAYFSGSCFLQAVMRSVLQCVAACYGGGRLFAQAIVGLGRGQFVCACMCV